MPPDSSPLPGCPPGPLRPAGADSHSTANARCPRCGGAFHCGAGDAAPCPCGTLTLGAGLSAELRRRYQGCLCLACLRQLAGAAV